MAITRKEFLRLGTLGFVGAMGLALPAVAAARRHRSDRARAIDLTRLLCSPRRCFAVIGGALVYKDDQHFTDVFSETLAPALRRALDAE